MKSKIICCIGAGYVGGPTMAVLADKNPSLTVKVVDKNNERIKCWNDSNLEKLPIYEPGLSEIIERVRNKNLFFSLDIRGAIESADIIFISVNTPTKSKGIGAGQASDLCWIENCAREVAKYAKGYTIVVEKSTIPVRTAEVIGTILKTSENSNTLVKRSFSILSNPEFLAEGTAISDLENPDRILIGGEDLEAIDCLANIYRSWIPEKKIIKTNTWSSELSKLVANAFLAQRISSINSISALCEETGADINEVAHAIGTDTRIGNKFLNSGPGFGGSCFKKDILNLVYLSNYFGLKEVGDYWSHVLEINFWQQKRISSIVVKKLLGTLSNKKISILGFSFKANTNDTRESPSIEIIKNLLEEGAFISIHDPKVQEEQIYKDLEKSFLESKYSVSEFNNFKTKFEVSKNLERSLINSDAAVVLTEWEIYKNIDWKIIKTKMRRPSWIFDTRRIIDQSLLEKTDINLWQIGK